MTRSQRSLALITLQPLCAIWRKLSSLQNIVCFDSEGNLKIIADVLKFEGVLDTAFNQIRQFPRGSTAVIIRLMDALVTIYKFTSKESHKKAVTKHAEMVLGLGKKTIKEKNDLNDLIKRAEVILKK